MPVARLDELQAHLTQVQADDSVKIDARLLDEVELQLTGAQLFVNYHIASHTNAKCRGQHATAAANAPPASYSHPEANRPRSNPHLVHHH